MGARLSVPSRSVFMYDVCEFGILEILKPVLRSRSFPVVLELRLMRQVSRWEKMGRPVPPSSCKTKVVKAYAETYNLHTFVETGTYYGAMIESVRNTFNEIDTIEPDDALAKRATERFTTFHHIRVRHGDSVLELRDLMPQLKRATLFKLDAHYSAGGTARGKWTLR